MTPEQINRIIAEKVMGWKVASTHICDHYEDEKGVWQALYNDFDPYHRIEHAMMALEKFPDYKLKKHTLSNSMVLYDCRLLDDDLNIFEHKDADTPSAAIAEAIVSELEGKE